MADELGGEKFIVYANYHTSCESIYEYCKKAGYTPGIVYGGLLSSAAKNLAAVERFKTDSKCRVLVGHPQSCGVGIDGLQHVTRAALFLELPSPALFQQAIGRIKRVGQHKNCVIKIAVAVGTVQVDLQRKALAKEDLIQQVVPTKESIRRALLGD
jgi:SNF2 family DNA or RNA helicase